MSSMSSVANATFRIFLFYPCATTHQRLFTIPTVEGPHTPLTALRDGFSYARYLSSRADGDDH